MVGRFFVVRSAFYGAGTYYSLAVVRLILHIRRTNARVYYVQAPWNALRTTKKRPTIDERRDLRDAEKGFNYD